MQPNPTFPPDNLGENPSEAYHPAQPDAPSITHSPFTHIAPDVGVSAMSSSMAAPTAPGPEPLTPSEPGQPVAVVRVLSTRGVEYGFMTIALWIAASTLAWVVLNLLNGSSGFNSVVVPVSALVVCLPVFAFFFLRLKRAELRSPEMRLDPSKRRWSQTTQFLAFIACLINLIYFIYALLQHASGGSGPSIGKSLINLVTILVIAGGVLAYYWVDEHRIRRN